MLKLYYSAKFKKDYKLAVKRHADMSELEHIVTELQNEHTLDERFCDHPLLGKYKGFRECHINPDWLLIYRIEKDRLVLTLARTGTHSDLF